MKTRVVGKLLFGFAFVLMLVAGAFVNANAACSFGCSPVSGLSACPGNCSAFTPPAQATCQGAYEFGPRTPNPMSAW